MVRVYTVEEAKALPPPTPDETAERWAALLMMRAAAEQMLDERGGAPLAADEFQDLFDDDGDVPIAAPPN